MYIYIYTHIFSLELDGAVASLAPSEHFFFVFCGPRFLTKLPNAKNGALLFLGTWDSWIKSPVQVVLFGLMVCGSV